VSWRFYPLAEYPDSGILVSPGGKPCVAAFIRPDKPSQRLARMRNEEKRLLEKMLGEAQTRSALG
jgi:hypothetical protein